MQFYSNECENCHLIWINHGGENSPCPECSGEEVLKDLFQEFLELAKKHPESVDLVKIDTLAIKISRFGHCVPWDWEEYQAFLRNL